MSKTANSTHPRQRVQGSKSEQAYFWIRERISRDEFRPGHRLVLGQIATALRMSVVPVREAIRRLEAEGLVTFEHNIGASVALIDEREYSHTMQTLGVIEGVATALSAPFLLPTNLDRAAEINSRMRILLSDFDPLAFTQLNQEFHSILYEPCPNPHIVDLVRRGWSRLAGLRESTFAFVPARAAHSVDEHSELLEMLRDGADFFSLELAARQHRWRTMDAYLSERSESSAPTHGGPPASA